MPTIPNIVAPIAPIMLYITPKIQRKFAPTNHEPPTKPRFAAGFLTRPGRLTVYCAFGELCKTIGGRVAVGKAAGGSLARSGTVASVSARRMGAFREPLLGVGLLIVALAAAFAVRQATATRADSLTRPGATATLVQAPVGIVAIRSIPAPGPLKLAPVQAHKARPTVSHPPAVASAPAIHRVSVRARSAPAVSAPRQEHLHRIRRPCAASDHRVRRVRINRHRRRRHELRRRQLHRRRRHLV